ncbi:MAG: SEC-C domain-containing protein [Acidimicrobiia bacterium]
MTLILVAMNSDYLVQLSDRRLSAGGQPVEEESNKSLLVHLSDGRLAVGYTGLATYGGFETATFLTDVMLEAAKPDFQIAGLVGRLPAVATSKWREHRVPSRVPANDRRLTISAFGFGPSVHHNLRPVPGGLLLSNVRWAGNDWETLDEFNVVKSFSAKPGMDLDSETLIYSIGATGSVTEEAVAPIRTMLREHRPAFGVVGKGVELMRSWARLSPAANTIGDQISSIVLPADITDGWTFDYHTAHPAPTLHHPIFVEATGRVPPFASRLEITQEDGAYIVQKVGRNAPCPCGSGQKYKRCHGSRGTSSKGELI